MTIKGRVLMLLDNSFTNDRRVKREAEALVEAGYDVTLLCTLCESLPIRENIVGVCVERVFDKNIFDPKDFNWHIFWAKKIVDEYIFDIVHAHDHTMLNLGAAIKNIKQVKLIYDSHELFHSWPLNLSNFKSSLIFIKSFLVRKWFIYREKKNAAKVDYLITVNQSIANNLGQYFGIDKTKIAVVRNTPEYGFVHSRSNVLRDTFSIPNETEVLVFIGANIYLKSLNIEQVFEEFGNKEKIALIIIASFNEHFNQVKKYVEERGFNNIYFHNKVLPEEISSYLSSADAGLVPTWNRKDLSYWYALDNKLFEYIQASIPVLATEQPEYKLIIEKYGCGVCVNPVQKNAYFEGFKRISSDKKKYQDNLKRAAKELCWELEKNNLTKLYEHTVDMHTK